MVESPPTLPDAEDTPKNPSTSQSTAPQIPGNGYPDIPIVGRLDKYRSPYWSGVVAALGLRYFPRPFWRDKFEANLADGKVSHFEKHRYSGFAGAVLTGVAGLYAVKTYEDIKTIFSETVGWEKGKKAEDVGFMDLWTSKNSVVNQTMSNYIKFNIRRFAVNSVYFLPFLAKKTFQKYNLHGETGVDWGVSANAAYLFHDILNRKMTPFEELQSLIDRKINHAEHYAHKFVATDLLDIYERHAANDSNKSFMPLRGSNRWQEAIELFSRMADLMNQSYYNETPHEHAKFGFSKFVYLLGHQLINPDNIERTRAYVEIANHYGVKAVDQVAEAIRRGKTLEEASAAFPLGATAEATLAETQGADVAPSLAEKLDKKAGDSINIVKKQPVENYAAREAQRKIQAENSASLAV